ncbi:MAG: hypothetical protein JETT_0250 [Candidatus Jettenia ecosi]|uniref:Uncharacterized protein n=1 Tax=Candidatus Jettenia ecosi TaxID=2494326 RepID=A0A533QFM0_9BACT|nr:MAG: hypothetical protein JETT_0250 [Candidatus Jettenia ecosi]
MIIAKNRKKVLNPEGVVLETHNYFTPSGLLIYDCSLAIIMPALRAWIISPLFFLLQLSKLMPHGIPAKIWFLFNLIPKGCNDYSKKTEERF